MTYILLLVTCLSPYLAFAQELVIDPPVDEIGFYSKSFSLTCKVPGLPDSHEHLEWLDRSDNIISGRKRGRRIYSRRLFDSLYLFFDNWSDNDAGTYTCRGDIFGRNMSKSVQLYFKDAQDIILTPSGDTSRVEDSGSYVQYCEAVGVSSDQQARIEWLDNNMTPIGLFNESDPKANRVYEVHLGRRCLLKFDQVKFEDRGKYTCRVSLGSESKEKSFRLNVYGVVTFPQEDVIKVEKQTGTAVNCQVTETQGGRNVTVDWLYSNGYTVSGHGQSNRHFAHKTYMGSTLFFDEMEKEDKGKYFCRANIDGNTVYKGIQLQFQVFPQIVITPEESSIRRKKGTSGSMYCKVKGLSDKQLQELEDAKFEWLDKHDNIIGPYMKDDPIRSRVYTLALPDATRLQLDQLTSGDRGTYTCRCTVGGNIMIKDINLNIYGKPDTPTNLQAVAFDDGSITITWDKGYNGDTQQRFNIQYRQHDGQWTTHPTMPRDLHDLELTLGGLQPTTVYDIRINAVNKYGSSSYTSVSVTTF